MNKENAISRINKIGKAGRIISRICMVFACIGLVGTLIGAAVFLILPKDLFTLTLDGTATVDVRAKEAQSMTDAFAEGGAFTGGSMDLNGDNYVPTATQTIGDLIRISFVKDTAVITSARVVVLLFVIAAYLAVFILLMHYINGVCKSFEECVSPFEEGAISSIRKCAYTIIPWAVLGGVVRSLAQSLFSATMTAGFDLNLTTILVVVLVLGLAHIFKYGAILQTESDETL